MNGENIIPINLKKKVKDAEGKSTRVLIGEEIPHDQEILDLLNPFVEKGKEALEVKVGSTPKLLQGDRDVIRFGQTVFVLLLNLAISPIKKCLLYNHLQTH